MAQGLGFWAFLCWGPGSIPGPWLQTEILQSHMAKKKKILLNSLGCSTAMFHVLFSNKHFTSAQESAQPSSTLPHHLIGSLFICFGMLCCRA